MSFKKLILAGILAASTVFGGTAFASSPIRGENTRESEAKGQPTVSNWDSHSVEVVSSGGKGAITWKTDLRIKGARGRACEVTVEMCDAKGNPHVDFNGKKILLMATVVPTSDDYRAMGLTFGIGAEVFQLFYGQQSTKMTFRISVRESASGTVIDTSDIFTLTGLDAAMNKGIKQGTDNPNAKPGRKFNRLPFGAKLFD